MYKVKIKYSGLLFSIWYMIPLVLKTRKEAETFVEHVLKQKNPKILDVKIEEI